MQSELLKKGKRLVGTNQVAGWGFPTFDAWVVDKAFAAKTAAGLAGFAKVIEDANQSYIAKPDSYTAGSAPVKAIAEATGAAPDQAPTILEGYQFLSLKQQADFLAKAPAVMKTTADFLKQAGRIDKVAADYAPFVNASVVKQAGQ